MKCPEIELRLQSYIRDELSLKEKEGVSYHLDSCTFCQREYNSWLNLENLFDTLDTGLPPQEFTSTVMTVINKLCSIKGKGDYWLYHWYHNLGRGMIAAGILGLLVNSSALVYGLHLEKSITDAFSYVEQAGVRYFEIYDEVSMSLENLNIKGGTRK